MYISLCTARRTALVDVGGDQTPAQLLHEVRKAFNITEESSISLYRARRNNTLEEMVLDESAALISSLKKSQIYVKVYSISNNIQIQ
jgi:hypothetical protein